MNDKGATFGCYLFFGTKTGSEAAAEKLALAVPGFDLMIVAGGYGEPTYQPQQIDGSKTKFIVTGDKAMYAGLVGLYQDAPMKYARVPLIARVRQTRRAMRRLMADYQQQLQAVGLDGLGICDPCPIPSGEKFVGSALCGECHTTAFDVWEGTGHADATASIVKPPENAAISHGTLILSASVVTSPAGIRSAIFRTKPGICRWSTKHLHGSGCENCHGPGSSHSAAGQKDSDGQRR